MSSYIQGLFCRYPETALRDLLAQLPVPITSLLRFSWELDHVDFDGDLALPYICREHLLDWSLMHKRILIDNIEPLDAIHGLIDSYVEVDEAAEFIAQDMHAAMQTFLNPQLVPTPTIVSTAERTRIACGIYLIKIYLGLQSKFECKSYGWDSDFPGKFLRSQKPWLVEQTVSVENFLRACCGQDTSSIYKLAERKLTCKDNLSKKPLFIKKYLDTMEDMDNLHPENLAWTAQSLRQVRHPHTLWLKDISDLGHPSKPLKITTQLENDGWELYLSVTRNNLNMRYHSYNLMASVGLFFWDRQRLKDWNLDAPTLKTAVEKWYYQPGHQPILLYGERHHSRYHNHDAKYIETIKTRQIVQWTRCPVQCTLEQSLWQTTALARFTEGRPFLPIKYIALGRTCSRCGLDGHDIPMCEERYWSDDE